MPGVSTLRNEVQLVRETLEGTLAPAIATATLFEALDRWGRGIPGDTAQVLELVRGPLSTLLDERLGVESAREVVASIEQRLAAQLPADLDVDVDVSEEQEDEFNDGVKTTQMAAVPHPVSVLVVSASKVFGERLLTVLGDDRVYPHTVNDEQAFRHAVFSALPLIAIVDTTHPPAIRPPVLATALRTLPRQTVAVIWSTETDYGRETRVRLEQGESDVVFLDRKEGIEPLLDLVLSRFKRASTRPPPED
jgi:hypothetical protein